MERNRLKHVCCGFRPNSQEPGPTVQPPFNETWAAMEELVDQGLVKSIGLSNFSPEKIQELLKTARIRPAVNQVRSSSVFTVHMLAGVILQPYWVYIQAESGYMNVLACLHQMTLSTHCTVLLHDNSAFKFVMPCLSTFPK